MASYGIGHLLRPDLTRIIAPNPSAMTYWGTNTYILGDNSVVVIDPGPNLPDHLEAIMDVVAGRPISHILVTHSHLDHSLLASELSNATGTSVYAFGPSTAGRSQIMQELAATTMMGGGEGIDHDFFPDVTLVDEQIIKTPIGDIRAIHTPGHFGNHMCFAWQDCLFCGDHVMGWSTSLVSPPDGDLGDFLASCQKLETENAAQFFPGHGSPIDRPKERLADLVSHRQQRTNQILDTLKNTSSNAQQITTKVYADVPKAMWPAAERNVLAHLIYLVQNGLVAPDGPLHAQARFRLI